MGTRQRDTTRHRRSMRIMVYDGLASTDAWDTILAPDGPNGGPRTRTSPAEDRRKSNRYGAFVRVARAGFEPARDGL